MSPNSNFHITKLALDATNGLRQTFHFANARSAQKAFIHALNLREDDEILLPAYIGWSSREGSGVFDPIVDTGAKYRFYRITRRLHVDLEDLRTQLTTGKPKLLILVHYFGFPDPYIDDIVDLARNSGVYILEDEAHALYSDWIGGACGRFGDAAIMSLHKVLPFQSGGLLILNQTARKFAQVIDSSESRSMQERNPQDYDLFGIAATRRNNAMQLLGLLPPLSGRAYPLFSSIPNGVTPQTFPIIISKASRDSIYFAMNDAGYGVVSLYHTLIASIQASAYPDSHWLSKHILNLPVHQDIQPEQLSNMISRLSHLI